MASIGPDEVKTLEQIRQRLQTLNSSFAALLTNFHDSGSQPLPPWTSLQLHSGLISNNLQNVVQQLSEHQQMLASMVAHPLPQYPNDQAPLLEHLLRTKPEPEVKEWLDQGREMAQKASIRGSDGTTNADLRSLWQWAPVAANDEIRKQSWGGDYTMAEKALGVDRIDTGLTRTLQQPPDPDEADEEDGIDESDEDDDGQEELPWAPPRTAVSGTDARPTLGQQSPPQMAISEMLRFVSSGISSAKPP